MAPCCSKSSHLDVPKTKFARKDSGYNTQFLNSSQKPVEFIPYKEPETLNVFSFEKEQRQTDLNAELVTFMENPESSKIFYPNFDYYEAKLIEENIIPNLKDFIRRSLQNELDKMNAEQTVPLQISCHESPNPDQSQNSVNPGTQETSNEKQTLPLRPSSPDLFESGDESNGSCKSADNFQSVLAIEASPDILSGTQQQPTTSNQFQDGNGIIQFSQIVEQTTSRKTRRLIEKVERTISKFLDKTACGQPMEFFIRNTNVTSNCYLEIDEILTLKPTSECALKRVSTTHRRSQFRFAVIMFLLAEIYHLLATGTTCTLRELYYKDPEFIRDPVNINLGLKDICCLLDAAPWELGVLSSSKGLVAGALVMVLSSGEEVDCSAPSGGILLPHDTSGVQSLRSDAKFALVVEKDTVFEKLLKQNIFQFLGPNIILITGKGFPDVNTRVIVKKIALDLKIPIYGLFDADPFGIEIFFVYRHGSRAMSFNADSLACPQMEWVGIQPSEIELLGIPSMTLTREDKKRLRALLYRPYISDEMKIELVTLERGDRKAEIEGLSSFSDNYLLTEYIPNKIRRKFTM